MGKAIAARKGVVGDTGEHIGDEKLIDGAAQHAELISTVDMLRLLMPTTVYVPSELRARFRSPEALAADPDVGAGAGAWAAAGLCLASRSALIS